jgi:hypothetical protein
MTAAYNLLDLIAACKTNGKVIVLKNALKCAQDDFQLNTQKAVLDFIFNDGLEKPQYINTKPWINNPAPDAQLNPIQVDAYSFYSGQKQGYFAFFFNTKTNKWLIKSFKPNKYSIPRSNIMANQLLALGFNQNNEEK